MYKKIDVNQKILVANEEYAQRNKRFLADHKTLCLNMISSPGSGKTSLLARTITDLKGKLKIGVIEGDIKTDLDAQKIRAANAPAIQIETEGACHLSAAQVSQVLDKLPIDELDVLFIENVGNLVCPSAFELGENGKVVVLSVAEGDDKPAKYPATFAKAKVMLINKIDLLPFLEPVDFNPQRVKADALRLNRDVKIFEVSAKTGEGMDKWYDWLVKEVKTVCD